MCLSNLLEYPGESVNARLRKFVKNGGHFSIEEARNTRSAVAKAHGELWHAAHECRITVSLLAIPSQDRLFKFAA
jgi:hypothetical protein